ncbi:MAG: lytic transglycosylase domain-containing protein, partial [Dehalococcoidia bacterium]
GDSDPWAMLAAAREAHELGMADVGVTLASRLRTAIGSGAPDDLERLLYPLDYVGLLDSEAEKYGFDPLFFAGLIRQESLWNPSAGSTAGALGLTQVIPPTGEAIAAELGVADFTPSDLFRPAVALRFGAYYIGGQLDHYEDPYVAMSAYNAGPGNAARWAAASAGGTPADFLAAVDFSETILYVELVWENYARYLRLYRPGS